jgi:hypothetical protein
MCIQNVKSSLLLRLGLAALAIANIVNYVVRRAHGEVDFLTGLLFGLSFGLLMLAMWRDRRDGTAAR